MTPHSNDGATPGFKVDQKKKQSSYHEKPVELPKHGKEVWLDAQQVKQWLNVSDRTLQKWRKDGVTPFTNIVEVGKVFYKESDILHLLEKNMRHKK